MQQLECFQFKTSIDINTGYYTIQLGTKYKDITTTVTEFIKFQYNVFPMGMVMSGDIFQAKVNELLGNIKGVKAYINDILFLNTGTFVDHVEKLRICFSCILKDGLRTNAKRCSFGLKDIPYLIYFITREGVKPDPKNTQVFMDLQRPNTTTDCKNLVKMVQ